LPIIEATRYKMNEESTVASNEMEIKNPAAAATEAEATSSSNEEVTADEEEDSVTDEEDIIISSSSSNITNTEPIIDASTIASPETVTVTEPEPSPEIDPIELISQALLHKDEGNNLFKAGNLIKASRSYRKGTSILKPLNQQNSNTDEQVKLLLISLQTNLSMVCFKQNKYQQSKDVASKVLLVDRLNVKALYRRAVASRKLKHLDSAREDLRAAYEADPDNRAVQKELLAVKKELELEKKTAKAALAKAFSSQGGKSFLYDDKEELEMKRAAEKKEKQLKDEDARTKRRGDWEDACVQRMSKGEEAISFDDYEKDIKDKEEEAAKAKDKLMQEQEKNEKAERRARKKAQEAAKEVEESDDSEDELTEKELQMLRGYKKTSDGRTTSYFSREQTEEEKKLLGNIAPQRLDATAAPQRLDSAASIASSTKSASVWNNAGTWEEKDTSDWCTRTLTSHLKEAVVEVDHYTGKVDKIEDLTGDASVAFVSGKKQFVFDYHASLTFNILDEADEKVASGTLKLLDISSTAISDELEVDVLAWKKAPTEGTSAAAIKCREALVAQVRGQVLAFVKAFNAQY
jgi:hypothetical protein